MLVTLKKQWNAALGQMVDVKVNMDVNMKSSVASFNELPLIGNKVGDVRITLDTKQLLVWANNTWNTQGHIDVDNDLLQYVIQNLS